MNKNYIKGKNVNKTIDIFIFLRHRLIWADICWAMFEIYLYMVQL